MKKNKGFTLIELLVVVTKPAFKPVSSKKKGRENEK